MLDYTGATGNIQISIESFMPDSASIPKLLELFDGRLKVVKSGWHSSNKIELNHLKPGIYTVRLSFSSGIQKDETVEVIKGTTTKVYMSIANYSPHESHEWAFFNKNISIHSMRGTNMKQINFYERDRIKISLRHLTFEDGLWTDKHEINSGLIDIGLDGHVFQLNAGRSLSLLEVTCGNSEKLFVSIPPVYDVKVLIRPSESKDEYDFPVDVTASTDDYRTETLITLLTNGNLADAKTLQNAEDAERLLYHKMTSPVAAAVGGYFLLKIGELNRLHDWARNLASIFGWLPDGGIIYATQLLSKKEKSQKDIEEIRFWLLRASQQGIPVYSEGLRLLEKGLTQLWYHSNQMDSEVQEARNKMGRYLESADMTQETTTFIGAEPEMPGRAFRGRMHPVSNHGITTT
jgi:hypothetical protein